MTQPDPNLIVPTENNPLLDTNQVAKICNVKPLTVRTWIKEGKLRGIKLDGTVHRVLHSDLVDFVNKKFGDSDA